MKQLYLLYRFDAVIADAFDNFRMVVDETKARDIKNRETVAVRDIDTGRAEENASHCLKGGTLPQERPRRIKALLSIAATSRLDSCYKILREEVPRQNADLKTELSVEFTGTKENRLNNVNREHTIAFRMRNNEHYYIGLTWIHAFSGNICDWMGLVNNCYILHSKHHESPFMRFQAQD